MSTIQFPKGSQIVLEGICGSVAYGLDTPESDIDIKGIFVAPLKDVLSLNPSDQTVDRHDPDQCYHEVAKYMKLALDANPTILELMFLEKYTKTSEIGKSLIRHRDIFLSNRVRQSYVGYAHSQVSRLMNEDREEKRAKHARHCFRLLYQAEELLTTGKLTVRVTPEKREELFSFRDMNNADLKMKFQTVVDRLDNIKSILPDQPNRATADQLLFIYRNQTLHAPSYPWDRSWDVV